MQLTNEELNAYVGRIKLTREMKRKYTEQIDNLIANVRKAIAEKTATGVTRVIRAGSWKKGTALRPRGEHPLDIDLVFFLDEETSESPEIADLGRRLLDFLLKVYPNKSSEDFKEGEKTVNLVFRGTGLRVDLVPVVPIKTGSEYVWQPTSSPGSVFITSVQGQLDFMKKRKAANPSLTAVIRILKAWKARQELEISSFALELLACHLDLERGVETGLEPAVVRFFEFVARDQDLHVAFPGAAGHAPSFEGKAYLGDPAYNPNNVLERLRDDEWDETRQSSETAWETIEYARSRSSRPETIKLWKEIMGSHFSIEAGDS